MEELHLSKKDFKIEWYSGSGAGGQHRNRHKNCCRLTHIDSATTINGTSSKSRITNLRDAFKVLSKILIDRHMTKFSKIRKYDTEVIRNYNALRNEVYDKLSGLKQTYKEVVLEGNIDDMIKFRSMECKKQSLQN